MATPLQEPIKAKPHSPAYMMHKFWARRPHNVFRELIASHTKPGDTILDPFCGGGVTVVEGLQIRRKVIGIDINLLATYVTEMEVTSVNLDELYLAYESLCQDIRAEILELYKTKCRKCGQGAVCDWIEWKEQKPIKLAYTCSFCGAKEEVFPCEKDESIALTVDRDFEQRIKTGALWFPGDRIPDGDKTDGLIKGGVTHFQQLFTKRNLLALALLWKSIDKVHNTESRNFLRFVLSSSLKWASRQSHRRGNIIEGWAMHAYWLYPVELEINVWNTFARRFTAIVRGKQFTNEMIGQYYQRAKSFEDIVNGQATCLILTQSSTSLPIGDGRVDAVITDPPYGGNVNYGELADYWSVWHRFNGSGLTEKSEEVIINKHQRKRLLDYKELLEKVFSECYRVLKPNSVAVVTFNNRDLGIVAAFVRAVTRAGFNLHPEGLLYQPPIRAYTTTFHAKELGSFTGDFIFTLYKENHHPVYGGTNHNTIKQKVEQAISEFLHCRELHRHTQADLRQQLYRILIPFLATYTGRNDDTYWNVVRELGQQLRSLDKLLPEIKVWCRNRYRY
ncbi:hypothetical protein ISS37_04815 [candidate division KSB1 bacterium]|nr:hypothetical protein [candidate division KSB1 bacterium]